MIRSFDEHYAAAVDRPPFSTSDEADAHLAAMCGRCVHDRAARAGDLGGCPLISVALLGRTPAEWVTDGGEYVCTERRDEGAPDWEPRPVPDPPGQGCLWPRARFEGVRMLTSTSSGIPA